ATPRTRLHELPPHGEGRDVAWWLRTDGRRDLGHVRVEESGSGLSEGARSAYELDIAARKVHQAYVNDSRVAQRWIAKAEAWKGEQNDGRGRDPQSCRKLLCSVDDQGRARGTRAVGGGPGVFRADCQ